MENLFGTVGTIDPKYLLANSVNTECIAVSMEPGHGTVVSGTVLYRKTGVLYAPAAKANVTAANNLVVLRDDIDTDASSTVAAAAAAYRKGNFIAGKVLLADGSAVDNTCDVVLRAQGIVLNPMDDWSKADTEANNTVG